MAQVQKTKPQINSLEKHLDNGPKVDNTDNHEYLLEFRDSLFEKIVSAFKVKPIEAAKDLEAFYGIEDKTRQFGSVKLFTGKGIKGSPIDLLILGWIANPKIGFSNLHITCYLNDTNDAPHLGFALGLVPEFFTYLDLVPRVDVQVDIKAMEYMEPLNQTVLDIRNSDVIRWFDSKSTHVRATISPIGLCTIIKDKEVFEKTLKPVIVKYIDYWIELVKNGQPPKDPETMKARDEAWRESVVRNDPMNLMADRFVGVAMRDRLLDALSGCIRD